MLPSSGRPVIKTPARAPTNWPRPRGMIDSCSLAPAVEAGSETVASIDCAAGGWTWCLEVLRFGRLVLLTRLSRWECDRRGQTGAGYVLLPVVTPHSRRRWINRWFRAWAGKVSSAAVTVNPARRRVSRSAWEAANPICGRAYSSIGRLPHCTDVELCHNSIWVVIERYIQA